MQNHRHQLSVVVSAPSVEAGKTGWTDRRVNGDSTHRMGGWTGPQQGVCDESSLKHLLPVFLMSPERVYNLVSETEMM